MKPQNESEAKKQPWKELGIGKTKYYELKKRGEL